MQQPLVVASAYQYRPPAVSSRMVSTPGNSKRSDAAQAQLDRAKLLVAQGLEARERLVPAADVHDALNNLAREVDACAVVVGRDLNCHVMRSVTEHVRYPVILTPAHQHPTGAVLAGDRREALRAWIRALDAFVLRTTTTRWRPL